MQIYWWFLIPAIALAIFSDKIDKATNMDGKLKILVIVTSAILALIGAGLTIKSIGAIY